MIPSRKLTFELCCSGFVLLATALPLIAEQASQFETDRCSREAQSAMVERKWDQAAEALEKLAKLAPDVAEVQGNLGLAYYSQGRLVEAATAFDRAIKLNPTMNQAELLLGVCYGELERNEEAVKILAPAFRRLTNEPMGRLIGLGLQRAYVALKQYSKATAIAEALVSRYPNDPEILFHVSRLYADRAYQMMLELMQVAPGSLWVDYAAAEVHESHGKYDQAVAQYKNVLAREPRLPGAHFRLGRALLLRSRDAKAIDEAQHEFEEELVIAPQNSDAEYELGEIYRERGQFEAALEHFSLAIRHHTQFEQAQIALARTLIHLGRGAEALPHLEQAVRLNPQNKVPHFLLGSVYRSMGNKAGYQKEMAAFEKLHQAEASLPSPATASQVTQQILGLEMPVHP